MAGAIPFLVEVLVFSLEEELNGHLHDPVTCCIRGSAEVRVRRYSACRTLSEGQVEIVSIKRP